jgi:hypothetical protein
MTLNQILIILLAILLVWWPIGGILNQRRGNAWLNWLQSGVTELGGASGNQWIRSFHTVGQLSITDLRAPFRSLDVLFTLENRSNLIMWFLRHLRGRRDELILQADLLANPVQELEVGARGRMSYDAYLARQKDNPFTQLGEQDGFRIAWRGKEDSWSIGRLRMFLTNQGKVILRMSVQRGEQDESSVWSTRKGKNLLLRADMTRMDAQSPAAFFAALREWAASLNLDTTQSGREEQDKSQT